MKPDQKPYQTILVLATALLIAFFVFDKTWLIYTAAGLMGISIVSEWVANKISWAWLKFSEVLGSVNSKVLLGLVFFLFLTPLALLYRLLGKNNLQLKKKAKGESYYTVRDHTYEAKDLKNLW